MKKNILKLEDVTLEAVKNSKFGCRNCLYQSCECSPIGVNFVPQIALDKYASCANYAYYD